MFSRMIFVLLGSLLVFNSYGESAQPSDAVEAVISPVAPGIWRLQFGEPEKFTPLTFRERDIALEGLESLDDVATYPVELDAIRCSISESRTVVYIPCDEPTDEIYGFGLDPNCYKQKGFRKELTVAAAPVSQTGASHGPVPFYVSTRGYGVYVDTAPCANRSCGASFRQGQCSQTGGTSRRSENHGSGTLCGAMSAGETGGGL